MKRNIQIARFIEKLEEMRDENFIEELKELRFDLHKLHKKFLDYIEIVNYVNKPKTYEKITEYLEENKEYYLDLQRVVNSLYKFFENHKTLKRDKDVLKEKAKEDYRIYYERNKEELIEGVKQKRKKQLKENSTPKPDKSNRELSYYERNKERLKQQSLERYYKNKKKKENE